MNALRIALAFCVAALLLLTPGCEKQKDQDNPENLDTSRIVSLGSTSTEIIYALGHGDSVVGVDASSLFPAEAQDVEQLDYYRLVGAEAVLSLGPTVVFAQEGTNETTLQQLRDADIPVFEVSDATTVEQAQARIRTVAEALGEEDAGEELIQEIKAKLGEAKEMLKACGASEPRVLALYARGGGTQLVMGQGTAGQAMIDIAGGDEVSGVAGSKPITSEAVVASNADILLVPNRSHQMLGGDEGLNQLPGVPELRRSRSVRVVTIDDLKLLNFGPRLGEAVVELVNRFYPDCG